MTTALIADDERLARVALLSLLSSHPEIEVVGEADSVASTVTELARLSPDLLFLDIQMPDGFGFEVFERTKVGCPVIFVTAYDAHALRAFEVNALDYLLKPVEPDKLRRALERVGQPRARIPPREDAYAAGDLICLTQGRTMKFARVEEIVAVFAADDYVEIQLASGYRALLPQRLREWQRRLPER
ncbi:MAG: response regulator, partial [Myxococcota bacterium]